MNTGTDITTLFLGVLREWSLDAENGRPDDKNLKG